MNVLVYKLSEGNISPVPNSTRLVVEDNVGESIHLHLRNFRLEMSVSDFVLFADSLENAREELRNGDS